MISRFFIDRPVFASVISILIVIAGFASMRMLPIAQYPDIIPPEVTVTTIYPGASAEVVASTVAAPLEQQINGVNGMIYMRSTSSNSGQLNLTVTFNIGTDAEQAAIDVGNRVQAALARLPSEVRVQGVVVNKRSSSILGVVTMFSPEDRYDPIYISNYSLLNVIDELKRVPGIGDAQIFGAKDYSMRIWLKPDKLAHYGLNPADVMAAIQEQNSQFAAGQLGQEPMQNPQAFTYTLTTKGRLDEPKEFENIILKSDAKGAVLRVKYVARVELGAQDYSFEATYNGKSAVAIGLFLQPGANAISTTQAVRDKMIEISKHFPDGLSYSLPFDTTKFVELSIIEVIKTFAEAIFLVLIVVYVFLQNARATLIPLLAIPVSLIGTFAGMYMLGFSINLLTLFGMVLSIGIVVDDAIVVLENFERIMKSQKISARDAAFKAMEEVTKPIIAIVLVLCAVFIPVGFMGGLTGEMYKQFAITIAVSVTISGIVALTLTPALCALFLKDVNHTPLPSLQKFTAYFERLTDGYIYVVNFFLRYAKLGMLIFVSFIVVIILLFYKLPTGLVPEEDQGYIIAIPFLLPGTSLDRTKAVTSEFTSRVMHHPAVSDVVTFAGLDILSFSLKTSAGVSFVVLKDWSQRTNPMHDSRVLPGQFMGMAADIKDAILFALNPPAIIGISMTGGFEMYLQDRTGGSINDLSNVVNTLIQAASTRPELQGVKTTISANVPQYFAHLDRQKAKSLNVPINTVFATMQSTFGSAYVNDFSLFGRNYRVSMQADAKFRENPSDLSQIFVRSLNNKMVPLSSLVRLERVIGPDMIERFDIFQAAKVMGNPAPGYSSGQALAAMEEVAKSVLPANYTIAWTGSAYQEKVAAGKGNMAFVFGIIMVFLILAALYERWLLPFAVVLSVPFAIFGALFAVWIRGLNNDVYFQIGLVTLIGLSAKNAILIIEFAVLERAKGLSITDAAIKAAQLRFRPIVMTSLAFILGCMPLVISSGAGAASRHSIGTGVIGGMLAATCIAVFFIPLFFKLIASVTDKK